MRRKRGGFLYILTKSEKGQALLEIALVLPILIMLLFGIVEFGRVGHAYLTLNHAAREGARLGITGAGDAAIIGRVSDAAATLQADALVITILPSEVDRVSGEAFTVELDYHLTIYLPMPDALLVNPLPLQGRAVMRME